MCDITPDFMVPQFHRTPPFLITSQILHVGPKNLMTWRVCASTCTADVVTFTTVEASRSEQQYPTSLRISSSSRPTISNSYIVAGAWRQRQERNQPLPYPAAAAAAILLRPHTCRLVIAAAPQQRPRRNYLETSGHAWLRRRLCRRARCVSSLPLSLFGCKKSYPFLNSKKS